VSLVKYRHHKLHTKVVRIKSIGHYSSIQSNCEDSTKQKDMAYKTKLEIVHTGRVKHRYIKLIHGRQTDVDH
jgi:hypothetical protein